MTRLDNVVGVGLADKLKERFNGSAQAHFARCINHEVVKKAGLS